MKTFLLLKAAIILLLLSGCNKDNNYIPKAPDEIIKDSSKDIRSIRLKTVLEQNLPSPYFHFTYNDLGYATQVSYASNLFVYQFEYKNGRLSKMINTKNWDTLTYCYTSSKVSAVMKHNFLGTKMKSFTFGYNSTGRLAVMQVFKFPSGIPTDSIQERNVRLQYYEKGNLFRKLEMYLNANNELEWTGTDEYSDYDEGTNVDDFYLLKGGTFDDLVFLPQARLQKNNPRKIIHTGVNNDFKVAYTYQYVNGLPVAKMGNMEWTRGSEVGQGFNFTNSYTY